MALEPKKVGNSEYEVSYTLEKKEYKDYQEKAIKELAKNISIKGFRKGNAPLDMIRSRLNPVDIVNKMINLAMNPTLRKVLEETKLVSVLPADVRVENVTDDKLTLVYTIVTQPVVTLGEYKGLDIKKEKVKVTEKDINDEIEHVLADNSELIIRNDDEAAVLGDTVVMDFKGYIDNKEFDGGSSDNYSLVLGSNQFIPGFEDQLVGAKPNSKVEVNVTFPEQYIKDLAGKAAKFVCMIHEIKTPSKPELNDDFVKSLDIENVQTVEEFKKYQEKQINDRRESEANNKRLQDLLQTIIDSSTLEVSDKFVQENANYIKNDTIQRITQNGLTFEQYTEITGIDETELNRQAKEEALKQIKSEYVLGEISRQNNLSVSREDLDNYYQNLANTYGMKVEDVRKGLQNNINEVYRNLTLNKVYSFLIENNFEVKKEKTTTTKKTTKKEEDHKE